MPARKAIIGLAAVLVLQSCALPPGPTEPRGAFQLYNHCGLERTYVQFDGSYWGKPVMEVQGDLDDPYDHGSMMLAGPDSALYVSDRGARIRFERLPSKPTFEPCR